ncbi:MAG: PKD domain-containing protein, partial [Deltaproteobacteria bacterium]
MSRLIPFGLLALLATSTVARADDITADAGGPYSVDAGSAVTLDASGTSYDSGDCSTPEYRWNLDGSGSTFTSWSTDPTATFDATGLDGPDSVDVVVQARTDCDGDTKTDSDSTTVVINNVPPVITAIDGPPSARVDESTDWTVRYSDVETADTHSVTWDWGDGASSTGATASHAWTTAGTYTVTVTVTDDDGGSDSASTDIEVNDLPAGDTGAASDTGTGTGTGGADTGVTGGTSGGGTDAGTSGGADTGVTGGTSGGGTDAGTP